MKFPVFVVAVAACSAPVAYPCFAQRGGLDAASEGSASTTSGGSDAKPADHGAERDDLRGRDARRAVALARTGAVHDGDAPGKGKLGATQGPKGVRSEPRIDLVTPDEGYAGRRPSAIRKPSILIIAPKAPSRPSANRGAPAPFLHPGIDGAIKRNAVGAVVPGVNTSGTRAPVAHLLAIPGRSAVGANNNPEKGKSVGRISYGSSSIGGPANNRSSINGTTIRRKY